MTELSPPPIGVFDSGVGGLSVLREIRALLPGEPLAYVADTAHVPYGTKPPEFIRQRSLVLARFLVEERGAKALVVACNTATTHAVEALREAFASVPVIGMEPAVKPATLATRSGVVGVLATGATLDGERFASLVERYATDGVEVLTQPCPGLVEQVEAGDLDGPETEALLRRYTAPLLDQRADTIVLGCTHYPFLRAALARILGPTIALVDTGAAVARQTARVLAANDALSDTAPANAPGFYTSGDPERVRAVMERLWGEPIAEIRISPAVC